VFGCAAYAVAGDDLDTVVPSGVEGAAGLISHLGVDVDGGDVPGRAGQVSQERGVVPGPGPDLQNPVAGLDIEVVKHGRNQARQRGAAQVGAVRGAFGDHGSVHVRLLDRRVGHEPVASNGAHDRFDAGGGGAGGDDGVNRAGA
jgi:hypothetical protein